MKQVTVEEIKEFAREVENFLEATSTPERRLKFWRLKEKAADIQFAEIVTSAGAPGRTA